MASRENQPFPHNPPRDFFQILRFFAVSCDYVTYFFHYVNRSFYFPILSPSSKSPASISHRNNPWGTFGKTKRALRPPCHVPVFPCETFYRLRSSSAPKFLYILFTSDSHSRALQNAQKTGGFFPVPFPPVLPDWFRYSSA